MPPRRFRWGRQRRADADGDARARVIADAASTVSSEANRCPMPAPTTPRDATGVHGAVLHAREPSGSRRACGWDAHSGSSVQLADNRQTLSRRRSGSFGGNVLVHLARGQSAASHLEITTRNRRFVGVVLGAGAGAALAAGGRPHYLLTLIPYPSFCPAPPSLLLFCLFSHAFLFFPSLLPILRC